MNYKIWLKEFRIPFLILPVLFVPIGIAVAIGDGYFNAVYAVLTLIGVVSLHISVNVLNDYFDYKSGIDTATTPTPFSGGSRVLPEKLLTSNNVLTAGILLLLLGSVIGGYIAYSLNFPTTLVAIIAVAIISVVGYSKIFAASGLGEILVALNFGPLLTAGTYYVQTGATEISTESIYIGLITGLLTAGILYINQFPDTTADISKGRRHLVARLGKKRAVTGFKIVVSLAYVVLAVGIATGILPVLTALGLLTIPQSRTTFKLLDNNYEEIEKLIPAMGNNVKTTIVTSALILVGYAITALIFQYWGFELTPYIGGYSADGV